MSTTMSKEGNVPIVLTVSHDGGLIGIENSYFTIKRPERENDKGVGYAVLKIQERMEEVFKRKPFALFQTIERKRLSREIILDFYNNVFECVKYCLDRWSKCYLIDFHGFANQPAIGNYDIIFGTNHRKTVSGNFDRYLGRVIRMFLLEGNDGDLQKLKVYVPDEEKVEGERFGATKDFTLVRWVKDREPEVNALQLEIYKDWLKLDKATDDFIRVISSVLAISVI